MMNATTPPSAWRNPWVIGWIALVVVVLLVNIAMVVLAYVTAPGLVVAGHYDRGENYGATLAARARAGELGWRATPDFGALRAGTPGEALLTLHDGAGNELVAERVTLHAYRPADARADFHTDLTPRAVGRYGAALTFPAPGAWDLVIEVQRGGERAEFAQRVHLR